MTDIAIDHTTSRRGPWLRAVVRRPAFWLGVALGGIGLVDLGAFGPAGPLTWILPLLALGYLVFGAARGHRHGVLRLQLLGLVVFTAAALSALILDPVIGQYVIAAGWAGHAAWDLTHRDAGVVPRWYVDFCVPMDLLVAAALVAAPLLGQG